MGGSYVTGNVGQATATADVRLSYSAEQLGYDVLGNAFRLWIRPAPDAEMIRIGDTLAVTALPFWYFHGGGEGCPSAFSLSSRSGER